MHPVTEETILARAIERGEASAMRLDRADALCAGLLLVVGACLCMQVFASGPWGARPSTEDEFAYLFQARTLAAARLTYPSPPHPEFFEAAHILVTPRFAARYLPGHAAILAPFVAAGAPWAGPCLLLGATAALLFLAARVAGLSRAAAWMAAALLLGASEVFPYFASYLSQTTSMAITAAALLALVLVRASPSRLRIAALTACVVGAALVRPFTGLALALAAAALLCWLRPPVRALLAAAPAALVGVALLLSICRATTGSWTTPPWALYARQYMPFDGPGMGAVHAAAPERGFPPHLQNLHDGFLESREKHTWPRLPSEAGRRLAMVARLLPSWILVPFAVLGLTFTPLWPAAIFALAYFLLQLGFHVGGAVYHLELVPWLLLSTAAGAETAIEKARRLRAPLRAAWLGTLAFAFCWTAFAIGRDVQQVWIHAPQRDWRYARWEPAFQFLREQHALVFIRYPRGWDGNIDLTYNDPDLGHAQLVRAIDRDDRDAELMEAFPDRPVYRLDALSLRLERMR
jgi:hypothetical protein